MINILLQNKKVFIYFLLILILGSVLRIYNINYDDLWSDEMASFWISDPLIPFDETLSRVLSSNWMILYEILLKYFHFFFGYDVHVSRYFSFFISILSLVFFGFLSLKIIKREAAILGFFLLSINIYHIKYSIELRSYILAFFLVTLFIYLVFKNVQPEKKMSNIKIFFINLIALLMLFCHPYTLLVVGSFIFFRFLKIYKEKLKISREDILLILSLIFTVFLFLLIYFQSSLKVFDENNLKIMSLDWIWQVKPSFYTNFYFSKFFGSRLIGIIYLLILLYCIFKFRYSLINQSNIYTFFVILLFFSYFIPLTLGYILKPILVDRYIFFVLIPIICLLSHFIFLFKSRITRYFFIILICTSTFLNLFLKENTGRQFYTAINPTKPEIAKALQFIDNSNIKIFTINRDDRYSVNTNEIYQNYLLKYLDKLKINLQYVKYNDIKEKPSKIWVIYIMDTTKKEFQISENYLSYKINEEKFFNNLNLYLLLK